ncbi:MAG: hypothetical protein HC915_15775 [Anaerolineae bacterium]|nr:hypothetical protein [Anaerolineae bacterium]
MWGHPPGEIDDSLAAFDSIVSSFRYGADATTYLARLGSGEARAGADLGFGALVEGSLESADATQDYTLALEADEVLDAQLYGRGGLDTVLTLLDADGNEVTRDDDSGLTFNARLIHVVAEAGLYTLRASAYDAGDFTLSVETLEVTPGGGAIAYGETLSGFVLGEDGEEWTFKGTTGDVVTIAVEATIDTTLDLLGPDGTSLTTDDDSGGNINPLITGFELPADGTYTIVVAPFFSDIGPYDLSLTTGE